MKLTSPRAILARDGCIAPSGAHSRRGYTPTYALVSFNGVRKHAVPQGQARLGRRRYSLAAKVAVNGRQSEIHTVLPLCRLMTQLGLLPMFVRSPFAPFIRTCSLVSPKVAPMSITVREPDGQVMTCLAILLSLSDIRTTACKQGSRSVLFPEPSYISHNDIRRASAPTASARESVTSCVRG